MTDVNAEQVCPDCFPHNSPNSQCSCQICHGTGHIAPPPSKREGFSNYAELEPASAGEAKPEKPEHPCLGCGDNNWTLINGHWACGSCMPNPDMTPKSATTEPVVGEEQTIKDILGSYWGKNNPRVDKATGVLLSAIQALIARQRREAVIAELERLLKPYYGTLTMQQRIMVRLDELRTVNKREGTDE